MRKIYLLIGMLSLVKLSNSQLLLTQDFNYSGNLTANGWIAHSAAGTNPLATTTGLTYAGFPGSGIGNAILVGNAGGEDDNITYTAQNTNGQDVFYSCMINVTDAAASKTGDYFMHIGNPGGATFTLFAARVFARIVGGNVNFGLSNTSAPTYGLTNFAKNTTYLLVVKYTINTGGIDNTSLWVIPSGIPANEALAGAAELVNTTTAGQDNINAIALRQGSTTTSVQSVVDGIRVGTTWASVTHTAPTVTSFTPTSGYTGTTVTITGTNLTNASAVTIGGTNAASYTVDNATQITATVGAGTTGTVSVTTPGGSGTSAGSFTYLGYITTATGTWNTGSTWLGGNVPPSNAFTLVTVAHDVTLDVNSAVLSAAFQAGKLTLGNNTLSSWFTPTGGSATSYAVTNGTGTVTINNPGGDPILFPVGVATYNPVTIVTNGNNFDWSVRVEDVVANVLLPYNTDKAINRTWHITPLAAVAAAPTVTFGFSDDVANNAQLVNPVAYHADLTRSVDVWHYSGTSWSRASGNIALTGVEGAQSVVLTGHTAFSPFAIAKSSGPLPVSLASFSGYKQGTSNKLQWVTSSESNNRGFDVQRSADGITYNSIGFVNSLAANGTSSQDISYTFSDNAAITAKYYYRLVQTDLNNSVKYSNIILIKGAKANVLTVDGLFPNPANSHVNVLVNTPAKAMVSLSIVDLLGRVQVVKNAIVETGSNTLQVNTSQLSSGVYFLKVMDDAGNNSTSQFVKQ